MTTEGRFGLALLAIARMAAYLAFRSLDFAEPNVRHERRAKGREAAFGTSARWRGSAPASKPRRAPARMPKSQDDELWLANAVVDVVPRSAEGEPTNAG